MDQLDLPSVKGSTTLEKAIGILKDKSSSGLVVDLPSGPVVLEVDLIVHTLREKGDIRIAEVKPRVTTIRVRQGGAAESAFSAGAPHRIQVLLDNEGAAFAVARIQGGVAHVISRREAYANLVRGAPPTLSRCRLNRRHVWLPDELLNGTCVLDGSAVDPL